MSLTETGAIIELEQPPRMLEDHEAGSGPFFGIYLDVPGPGTTVGEYHSFKKMFQ